MYAPRKNFQKIPSAKLLGVVGILLTAGAIVAIGVHNGSYAIEPREVVATLVWWTLGLGVLTGLLPRASVPASAWAIGLLVTLFGVLCALSGFWAASAEKAFIEADRAWLYAGVFLLVLFLSPVGSVLAWARAAALGTTAIGLVALVSRLYPHLFSEPAQTAAIFPSAGKRLSFPVGYWNGLATLVAIALPLLFGLAVAERRPWARALALAPIPALVGVVYMTSSRGGALAAILAVIVFAIVCGRFLAAGAAIGIAALGSALAMVILQARTELVNTPLESAVAESQGRSAALWILLFCVGTGAFYWAATTFGPRAPAVPRRVGLAVGAICVLAAIVAIAAAHPRERFQAFKDVPSNLGKNSIQQHLLSSTSNGRWQLWQAAGQEFKEHPLLGGGAGSYEAWWAEHGTLKLFVRDAHSLYVEVLGELGIVGFVLLVGTIALGLVMAARRLLGSDEVIRPALAGVVAAYVAFVFEAGFDWMWELTIVAVVAFLLLAVATGPAALPRGELSAVRAPFIPAAVRIPVVALAACFFITAVIQLISSHELGRSQTAISSGDAAGALDHANAARTFEPWASSPWLQLALVREVAGDVQGARQAVQEALDRDDSDWRIWLVSARVETKLGNLPEARRSLAEAKRLNPHSSLFDSS
jgi:hypothetical protein